MLPTEIRNKRVLISALNWGMGHVSRCIALIDILLENQNEVFIAADDQQQMIFKQYFPEANYLLLEGYPFKFGSRGNFGLDLLRQLRPLQSRLKQEYSETELLVSEKKIEVIISDHRYGFLSSKAYSILLTHQLNLPVKWYENWVQKTHHKLIAKFDEIWVPDTATSDYAGILSQNNNSFNTQYIGHLSRLKRYEKPLEKAGTVIIASGPDTYAIPFVKETISNCPAGTALIATEGVLAHFKDLENFQVSTDWLKSDQMIMGASKIISRSGYSTLMDLVELKTPFSITPTPGQREQEYLFDLWSKKFR
jgi:hypothetical protein